LILLYEVVEIALDVEENEVRLSGIVIIEGR
jgi:hypothetical protein